jgi:restriction system protein
MGYTKPAWTHPCLYIPRFLRYNSLQKVSFEGEAMKNRSTIEEILKIAVKSPVAGVVYCVIFAGVGLYLTNKQAPAGAQPSETLFLPMMHLFGKISYFISAMVLIVTGIGFIVTSVKRKKQTEFFATKRSLDDIKNLSWKEFEKFIGSIFVKLGYSVEVTGGSSDGGVDLVVKKDGRTSHVQCKNYRVSKVSLSMVRDFYGAMNANLNFEAGYFITTGMFTLEAENFADDKPIELIDGAKLMDYVRKTSAKEAPQGKPVSDKRPIKAPICPRCGADMVLRTAKKGDKAGAQFWGCSTYPKCKGTREIGS